MKYDHFSMLPERAFQPRNGRTGMTLEGGGGGGGHTTSTVTQSSIPDWLRPQTEALLGAATQEIFNTQYNPATGTYDITGTRGYTPYSTDPRDYVAGFTPQEEAVMQEAAGMQSRPEFGAASQYSQMAGMGGLDTAGQAFGYGAQAAGMGGLYEQMATSPESMQAYMSPYMQNVIDVNKRQAISDAQRGQLGANLAAARQGTYGGSRQAVLQAEREAALGTQLADIQNRGMQEAFDRAQQAQQFGVTTGLQGLQTGIAGAQTGLAGYNLLGQMGGQMADIGTGAQASDIARMNFQQQMGSMPREMQQRIIDQAISDYAMGELAPQQNLSFYNALLRGYATPTMTQSSYQAGPNALQSIGALGTAAGGFGTLLGGGKKAGGVIKLAKGGITDTDAIESFAEDLSIPQLQQSMRSGELKGKEYIGMPILQNKVVDAERMKMAQAMMGQQGQQQSISDALMAKADQLQGITDEAVMAGGGIVAFQAGGMPPTRQEEVEQYLKERTGIMGEDEYLKALKARAEKEPSIYDRLSSAGAQIGLAGSMLRDPGQFGTYAKQAAELQGAQRKSAEERELAFLAAQRAERETKGKAFDVIEGRRQEAAKAESERKFKSSESAADRASREAQAKADRESREQQAKEDRASREAIARIPGKEIQVAQQLMAKDPSLSYLDAIDKASKALSPKDTYNSTRNALTKAADAVGAEMKNLELMNPDVKKLREKALKGDKTAQAQYQEIRNGVEQRVFKEYQVEGVNLSKGAVELKDSPTKGVAPKPAAPTGIPVTTPDGQTFYFPNQKAADDFKSRAGIK